MEDSLFDEKKLAAFKKAHLINLVLELQKEKNILKSQQKSVRDLDERVTELERSHYLYQQYGRRESVEISGIPLEVDQKTLEGEVMKVFNEAGVTVHGRQLNHFDMSACHRVGKHGVTIVRFVNRKFAKEGLMKGKNLKGTKIYGNNPVYINNSFCKEFKFIGFVIRRLKKRQMIEGYKIKNGVYRIKVNANDEFVEISHKNDFSKYNLDIETVSST